MTGATTVVYGTTTTGAFAKVTSKEPVPFLTTAPVLTATTDHVPVISVGLDRIPLILRARLLFPSLFNTAPSIPAAPIAAEQVGTWQGSWNSEGVAGSLTINLAVDPLVGSLLSGYAQLLGNPYLGVYPPNPPFKGWIEGDIIIKSRAFFFWYWIFLWVICYHYNIPICSPPDRTYRRKVFKKGQKMIRYALLVVILATAILYLLKRVDD